MNITPAEETILKGLCESGVDVTIQMVPEDSPVNVEKVLQEEKYVITSNFTWLGSNAWKC